MTNGVKIHIDIVQIGGFVFSMVEMIMMDAMDFLTQMMSQISCGY